MKDKAEIKNIVLDLGGKEVVLTFDQAKKLSELLGEMFGEKTNYYPHPYPILVDRIRPYWNYPEPIWCDSGTGATMSYSDNTVKCSLEGLSEH